jgi:hypothetical protein
LFEAQKATEEAFDAGGLLRLFAVDLVFVRRQFDVVQGEIEEERLARYRYEFGREAGDVDTFQIVRVFAVHVESVDQVLQKTKRRQGRKWTLGTSATTNNTPTFFSASFLFFKTSFSLVCKSLGSKSALACNLYFKLFTSFRNKSISALTAFQEEIENEAFWQQAESSAVSNSRRPKSAFWA